MQGQADNSLEQSKTNSNNNQCSLKEGIYALSLRAQRGHYLNAVFNQEKMIYVTDSATILLVCTNFTPIAPTIQLLNWKHII